MDFLPLEVDKLATVFGGDMKRLMIPMCDIPKEFKNFRDSKWSKVISCWFFRGLSENTKFVPKEGIDPKSALNHIAAILRSFEPKHEHKEACCAYLLSLWFEDILTYNKGKQ